MLEKATVLATARWNTALNLPKPREEQWPSRKVLVCNDEYCTNTTIQEFMNVAEAYTWRECDDCDIVVLDGPMRGKGAKQVLYQKKLVQHHKYFG